MASRRNPVLNVVLALLVVWLVLAVVGLLVKGLFYLFVIAVVLVVLTVLASTFRAGRRSARR